MNANPHPAANAVAKHDRFSAAEDYAGGDIQLFDDPGPASIPQAPGYAVIYPTCMAHRVCNRRHG